jgi:hypothetical protein
MKQKKVTYRHSKSQKMVAEDIAYHYFQHKQYQILKLWIQTMQPRPVTESVQAPLHVEIRLLKNDRCFSHLGHIGMYGINEEADLAGRVWRDGGVAHSISRSRGCLHRTCSRLTCYIADPHALLTSSYGRREGTHIS